MGYIRSGEKTKSMINYSILSINIIGGVLLSFLIFATDLISKTLGIEILEGISGNIIVLTSSISLDLFRRTYGETSLIKYEDYKI